MSDSKKKPPKTVNDGKFEVEKRLGAGCFGEVYKGISTETNSVVAIKTEDAQSTAPQLEREAEVLKMLRNNAPTLQGFAECFYYGQEGMHNCMVMDLLGKSIEDMVQKCNGKFTAKTSCLIAQQLFHRIEYLHSKGYVHRDIKPENFMFGVQGKIHHVYLIDFGLSKRYWENKKHSPPRQNLSLTGTARYASIGAHKGYEQGRRDDLEAIGHMLMYFLRGALPWSGLDAKTKQEKYRKIMEKKETTPLPELCAGHPEAFRILLAYARKLEFAELPDYDMVQWQLQMLRQAEGVTSDHDYQWFESTPPKGPLVELLPRVKVPQPDERTEVKKGNRRGFCFCGSKSGVRE